MRTRQKIAKAARTAEKYLVLCRTWVTWRKKIEASRRERKAREFELGKVKRIFNSEPKISSSAPFT